MGVTELANPDRVASDPFLLALDGLALDRDDFVIFGSGPMMAHNLRQIHDLDLVARGASWEWAREFGEPTGESLVRFVVDGGEIEIGPQWFRPPLWDTDDLIDNAEIFSGYRFARLEDVRRYKRVLRRRKDLRDIALIDAYLTARRFEP